MSRQDHRHQSKPHTQYVLYKEVQAKKEQIWRYEKGQGGTDPKA